MKARIGQKEKSSCGAGPITAELKWPVSVFLSGTKMTKLLYPHLNQLLDMGHPRNGMILVSVSVCVCVCLPQSEKIPEKDNN